MRRHPQSSERSSLSPPHTLLPSSLYLWLTHRHTASSNVGSYCSLLFYQIVQRLHIQDGESGWKQKRLRGQRAIKWKVFRIMARTGMGLLTEALMESHLLQTPKMVLESISKHACNSIQLVNSSSVLRVFQGYLSSCTLHMRFQKTE